MTLFDYQTTPFEKDVELLKNAIDRPTFMYTMPLGILPNGKLRVFFEETSLVGRDKRRLSFAECKLRANLRLEHHGINVYGIEEEEYCYIPMGGELPDGTQRIVAFGAAANMVHPSTGYQACRMLASSTDVAEILGKMIKSPQTTPDEIAATVYANLWNAQNRGQRDFQAFGGEFLMLQSVDQLRGFFDAFFAIDQAVWSGFLAGWPGLPGNSYHESWNARLKFCLELFFKMPMSVRLGIIWYSIVYTFEYGPNTLLRSLTPLLGQGPSAYAWKPPATSVGDLDAKEEARKMISVFKPSAISPLRGNVISSEEEEVMPSPFVDN